MKKIILIFIIIIIICFLFFYWHLLGSWNTTCGGGIESAYATWYAKKDIFSYHVYIRSADTDEYKKVDNTLIRQYRKNNKTYWRVDALGLLPGKYQFKIVPIVNQNEESKQEIITNMITVKANTREGFSFSKHSTNGGNSSGGYLENGTMPKDAKVVYITDKNVNTVTLDITKKNGENIKAIGLSEILTKWREETYSKHLIIRILGKINKSDIKSSYIELQNNQGVTIEGIGNDATLNGFGILIQDSSNIEIRNLGFMLFDDDAISLKENNHNIWIHHNDFFYGKMGNGDKAKGDGSTDIKSSQYITISYNHYWDSGKVSLCGLENDLNYITYHHNWFDHSDSRCPRVRYASVHIYNNYYNGNAFYSIGATMSASVFVESNVFFDCKPFPATS